MGFEQLAADKQSSRNAPIVFVVDDDVSVRESLELLIQSAGWRVETFASASAFLKRVPVAVPNCLILDVSLPDVDGLELQRRVGTERPDLPIIFITGHGDVPTTVRAMKAGAVEFLVKPFSDEPLLSAVGAALQRSYFALERYEEMEEVRARYESLSQREREVMALVVSGRLNKQAGAEMHITETTVKAHRGKVMRKMQAGSLADLVKMAALLGDAIVDSVQRQFEGDDSTAFRARAHIAVASQSMGTFAHAAQAQMAMQPRLLSFLR